MKEREREGEKDVDERDAGILVKFLGGCYVIPSGYEAVTIV